MSADPIIITSAADDNFAMPMAVMAFSVLDNLYGSRPVHFYFMGAKMSETNKAAVETVINDKSDAAHVTWLDPPVEFTLKEWKVRQGLTDATLLCLLLPDCLPDRVQKVIYLDCDLVVRADLESLWQQDISEHPLLAVQDFYIPYVSHKKGIPVYRNLGLSPSTPYFNAGVLVINREWWCRSAIGEKALAYLVEYADVQRYNDQEALNAVVAGDFGQLPLEWNQQTVLFRSLHSDEPFTGMTADEFHALKHKPKIIHYTEQPNPWIGRSRHPYRRTFLRYLRESDWYSAPEWLSFRARYTLVSLYQSMFDMWKYACDKSRPLRHGVRRKVKVGFTRPTERG